MSNLLIAASGTGGHIFPALAVASAMPSSWKCSWIGVPDRLETKLVPKKFNLTTFRVGALQAKGVKRYLQLFRLLVSFFEIRSLLIRKDIKVIFTTGGYISAPVILAAKSCRIPIILHESNAYPGKVTRLFGRYCDHVAFGIKDAINYINFSKYQVTGTPLRSEFLSPQTLPEYVPEGVGPLIIIMGGSQGALGLNKMVRPVIPELLERGCRVIHLIGSNNYESEKITHSNFVEKKFSMDIPALLQHADLAISRSGSGAITELIACKLPSILIPYPYASDQHQEFNALHLSQVGAALLIHEHGPEEIILRKALRRLLACEQINNTCKYKFLEKMKLQLEQLIVSEPEKKLVRLIQSSLRY